jgi:hypothetical protein
MPDTGQGMSVGDAVLSFIGDTTRLDESIDSLPQKVEAGVSRASGSLDGLQSSFDATGDSADDAGEEVQEAMGKSSGSVREARGEVALLGEEFGVRLPRHVQTFVAQLPGVGEALESAFAATAVLFIVEAIAKLTEKITDFISITFIYTEAMKSAEAATASLNATILANAAEIAKLDSAYDALTMTPLQLLIKQLDDVNGKIEEQQKVFRAAQDTVYAYKNGMDGVTEAQSKAAEQTILANSSMMTVLVDQNRNLSTEIQKIYDADAKKHSDMLKKELADQDQYNEETKLKTMQTMDEITDGVAALRSQRPALPELIGPITDFQKYEDAARVLGITLKSSLVTSLNSAKTAFVDLQASGKALPAELDEAKEKIKELQAAVDHFGQETPKVNQFFEAFKQGGDQSKAAMFGFGDAYGAALSKVFAGEESLGAAMATATKQFIGQIGARALVQGMFYFAQGIADSVWAPQNAAVDFAAAAEFFAIGAVTSAAAGAMPGGSSGAGGGSGSGFQGTGRDNPNSPIQTTGSTSQTVSGGTHVQSFASGGLISAPTLAMLGDSLSGPEAVLPLGDEATMSRIADHIMARISSEQSSASGHTFNMRGHFSKSEIKEIAKKLSRAVQYGTSSLHSSSTGRVVKRSP